MMVNPGKIRRCWNCGADMGFIENRYYDRRDTCGSRECEREARNQDQAERDEAHERLDRYMGW
jgi:anaerobic ribonucleoside-triphosphate reductase